MRFNTDRLVLELKRSLRPFAFVVGLIVVAVICAGIITRNLTFVRPWESYRTVKVQFSDVKGIFPGGHQVRLNGVKVGTVSKAKLVNGQAILTLKIEHKWGPVYKNAQLRIRPVTPLEDLYVNITNRGTPSAGEAKGGYVIPAQQTIAPVDVSRVLDTFDADTRGRMATLLTELGQGLGTTGGDQLRQTFVQLAPFLHVAQTATKVLAQRQVAVKRVIHNFGDLSQALATRDQQLTTFVRKGNDTLGTLSRNDQPLSQTLQNLGDLIPTLRASMGTVQQLSGKLDPALTALHPVAANLKSGLTALEKFGNDAQPALTSLRPALDNLRPTARTLVPTATKLDQAFTNLRVQAPQFNDLTGQLSPCMNALQNFFQNTLSVLKYQDAYGAFPRAETTAEPYSVDNSLPLLTLRKQQLCNDQIK